MSNKTILHLGSGKCSELEEYIASDAKKIVLVEANISIVDALHKKNDDSNRVEILNFAISDKANGKLKEFNLIDASSLHKPTGLLDLFPGLEIVREIEVNIKTASGMVSDMGLVKNEVNLLVIDVPGEEFNSLKNLQETNLLYLFSQIHLHCGVSSLYQDAKSSNEILDYLKNLGYDLVHQEYSKDPGRPCWTLLLNTLFVENKVLKAQLNHLQQEQDELVDELREIKEIKENLHIELVDARQTTSLSVKLQTLKESDLRDLQKKYSEALIVQDSQHQLLTSLSERLSLASNYFHQISSNQSVIAEERKILVQKNPVEPRTTKKKKARKKRL